MNNFIDIPNYEGLYYSNKFGNIYSHTRKVKNRLGYRIIYGQELKPQLGKQGYLYVNLYKDGIMKSIKIHKIVCLCFLGINTNNHVINHKDGNKLNNNVDNLEYCSISYNNSHAFSLGLNKGNKGKTISKNRIAQYDKNMNLVNTYDSAYKAEKDTGINMGNIYSSIKSINNYGNGYRRRFI